MSTRNEFGAALARWIDATSKRAEAEIGADANSWAYFGQRYRDGERDAMDALLDVLERIIDERVKDAIFTRDQK